MSAIDWIVLIVVALWLIAMTVVVRRRAVAARARAAREDRSSYRSHAEASRHAREGA